jgi:hypothetical protein
MQWKWDSCSSCVSDDSLSYIGISSFDLWIDFNLSFGPCEPSKRWVDQWQHSQLLHEVSKIKHKSNSSFISRYLQHKGLIPQGCVFLDTSFLTLMESKTTQPEELMKHGRHINIETTKFIIFPVNVNKYIWSLYGWLLILNRSFSVSIGAS